MNQKLKINLLGIFTVLLWGASYPVTKIAHEGFSSGSISFLRCLIAAVILLALAIPRHQLRRPEKGDILPLLICAVGFAGYLVLYSKGLETLSSAGSSLLVALTPIMTAILSGFLWKEKIRLPGWLCILTAFCGVAVLLLWGTGLSASGGIWWTLAAVVVFTGYNICSRMLAVRGWSAVGTLTIVISLSAVLLLYYVPGVVRELSAASLRSILAAVFLGVCPSGIAYIAWNYALSIAERTNDVTNYMFVTPLFSTLVGVLLIAEMPGLSTIAGGIIIILSMIGFSKFK